MSLMNEKKIFSKILEEIPSRDGKRKHYSDANVFVPFHPLIYDRSIAF
jgi:hypothetical protein